MTRLVTRFAVLGVAAIVAAPATRAQDSTLAPILTAKPLTFGVEAGVTIPFGDWKNTIGASTGFGVQGNLMWMPPSGAFGYRIEAAYNRFDVDRNVGITPGSRASGDYHVISGVVNIVVPIPDASMVKPYVTGGIGLYGGDLSLDQISSALRSERSTNFGVNGGVGVLVSLGRINAHIEARLHSVFDGLRGSATGNISRNVFYVPILAGIQF